MLKILNKKTNMVFILPDEKAINTVKQDKEIFEILDGGYVEEEPPRQPTIAELIIKDKPLKEEKKEEEKKEPEKPLEEMTCKQLYALMQIYGIKGKSSLYHNKTKMIEIIKEYEEQKRKGI